MKLRYIAFCLLATVFGCGGERAGGSYVVGDTAVVSSEDPIRGTAELREVLRIGDVTGDPEYLLARVSMFTVGHDGSVFVAQSDGDLRRYDRNGTYLGAVARPGQGPGEVQYVIGMDVDSLGRLAVFDLGNQRVSIYSPDMAFERQIRRPSMGVAYGRDALQWDSNGNLWMAIHPRRSGQGTVGTSPRPIYGQLGTSGAVVDTVFLPIRAWEGCSRRRAEFAVGFWEDSRLPYLPFAQWTFHPPSTLVFGCAAEYSFDVETPSGVRRIVRDWDAPVITDEERAFHTWVQDRPGKSMPGYSVPRERPAFLRIWRGDDGRYWLWRGAIGRSTEYTAEEREAVSRLMPGRAPLRSWRYYSPSDGFDVFDADGSWLGHVPTPPNWDADPHPGLRDPFFRGDTVWAVTNDDLGVKYISKFVVDWHPSN